MKWSGAINSGIEGSWPDTKNTHWHVGHTWIESYTLTIFGRDTSERDGDNKLIVCPVVSLPGQFESDNVHRYIITPRFGKNKMSIRLEKKTSNIWQGWSDFVRISSCGYWNQEPLALGRNNQASERMSGRIGEPQRENEVLWMCPGVIHFTKQLYEECCIITEDAVTRGQNCIILERTLEYLLSKLTWTKTSRHASPGAMDVCLVHELFVDYLWNARIRAGTHWWVWIAEYIEVHGPLRMDAW